MAWIGHDDVPMMAVVAFMMVLVLLWPCVGGGCIVATIVNFLCFMKSPRILPMGFSKYTKN